MAGASKTTCVHVIQRTRQSIVGQSLTSSSGPKTSSCGPRCRSPCYRSPGCAFPCFCVSHESTEVGTISSDGSLTLSNIAPVLSWYYFDGLVIFTLCLPPIAATMTQASNIISLARTRPTAPTAPITDGTDLSYHILVAQCLLPRPPARSFCNTSNGLQTIV